MRTPDPGSCSWRSRPVREPDRSMAASNVNGGRAPRRYRFGIRARTLCGMAVLLAVLLATSAMLIVDSWTRLRVARGAEARNHAAGERSEEHTSELQSLMRNSYAVFCLKKKKKEQQNKTPPHTHPTN